MWVSPNFQDTDFPCPLTIQDKINIFLDRTYGWQLDIADQCINGRKGPGESAIPPINHAGFAVLHIVLSFFEMIAKYHDGFVTNGKSEHYFKLGVYYVFPQLRTESSKIVDSLLNALYFGARCGLYHGGMTDHRIVITGETGFPMVFDHRYSRLKINPHLLVPALKAHLAEFGALLQNPDNIQLRRNFEKRFDYDALKNSPAIEGYENSGRMLPAHTPERDIIGPNLQVIFCNTATGGKGSPYSTFYSDNRNRFWTVLYRIGLTPRPFSPHESRTLPRYGIGLTTLEKNLKKAGSPQMPSAGADRLRQKIERLRPAAVAFNGKKAAEEFYGSSVYYGQQPEPVAYTTLFVLPSTSGLARKYWNEKYWRELAEFVRRK